MRPSLLRRIAFALATLVAAATQSGKTALAQKEEASPPVSSGTQDEPPAPASPAESEPQLWTEQRQAVRGCPVDADCRDKLGKGLREFELEAFPRREGGNPWIDGDDASGHDAVRQRGRRGDGSRRVGRARRKPSQLRPDLPWLDKLELPDIPFRWDDRIIKYLEFYKDDPRGRQIMTAWLEAQGRYGVMIRHYLRKSKLPEDLLYVAMIESAYNSTTYSRAGASGLWQFMPAGGKIYGLEQDRWIDERNDPVKATKAVMIYFADLYQRFGDWELALAAYNAGYGAVLKSMAKYNTNDFWQLLEYENALPWESGIYVPKAVAAAIVGHNRELFGYSTVTPAAELEYDTVGVPRSVPVATIARASGATVDTIARLNPHLRQNRTPPGKPKFVVRIPKGSKNQFATRFAQMRSEWDRHDAYVVRHGERFEDIARMHGVTPGALRELNGVTSDAEITGGTVIVVPRVSEDEKQKNVARARDDLYRSGVGGGKSGDKLIVPVPDPGRVVRGKQRMFYRVVAGDSQTGIARAFGVGRDELADWNGLDPEAHITARMVLQVWVDKDLDPAARNIAVLDPARIHVVKTGSTEHIELAEERIGRKRVTYECKKRESFEQVGKKFGLTARDLARINRMPFDTVLEPGQTILVYQVVDARASDRAGEQARQRGRTTAKRPERGRKRPAQRPAQRRRR